MRKGLSFLAQSACQSLTAALLFACAGTVAAQTAGTADEVPAISRAIAALIKTRHFYEAEALANKGLALCDTAPGAKGLCVGQFNDSLGDIAYLQKDYSRSLNFFQKAVEARERILDGESALIFASQVRLGRTYLALNRVDEAEPLLKKAIAGLNRAAPLSSNLGVALETLRRLYAANGRIDEEVGVQRSELEFHEKAEGGNVQRIQRWRLSLHDALVRQAKSLSVRKNEVEAERTLLESIKLIDPPPPGAEKYLSVSLAEEHYRQALAIDERAVGPNSSAVADDLVNLAPLLKRTGKFQDAKDALERALAIKVAQFGADSPMTTGAILGLASGAYEVGNYADARNLADRARQIQERTFGPEHYALVGRWIFSARLGIVEGKLDDAGTCINHAAHLVAKILSSDHPSNIDVLGAKADLARARGDQTDAEQHLRGALSVAEKLFEPDYPVRRATIDRLTGGLWAQGKFADAEHLQREELSNVELKRGSDHPSIAIAARGLAAILGSSGRQNEAAELYRRALAIDERAFGAQSDQAAWDHLALGSLFRRMGQFEGAQTQINLARAAWESQGRLLAANSALEQLALLSFDRGSPAEGVIYIEKMLNIAEQAVGNDSPVLVPILAQLGCFYSIAERHGAAEKILVRITGLIGRSPPEQTPGYLNVLQLRAELNAERGDVAAAEEAFNRVIAIATKYSGAQASAVGISSFNLATVYLKAGRFQDAIRSFAKALDIFKRESGDRAPIVGYTLMGAAQAYAKIGDELSSKALLATAVEILGPTFAAQRPPPRWL